MEKETNNETNKELSVKERATKRLNEVLLFYINDKATPSSLYTNTILNELKVIKETLALLDAYDWKQQYSEYGHEVDGKMVKEVAVWEQNSNLEIRNHKTWIVAEYSKLYEKHDRLANADGLYQCICSDAMTAVFAIVGINETLDYNKLISIDNFKMS